MKIAKKLMSVPLPLRLLLVAIATIGLYQGCGAPIAQSNPATTESATPLPPGTRPDSQDAEAVESTPTDSEAVTDETAEGEATENAEPAAVVACDLAAQLEYIDNAGSTGSIESTGITESTPSVTYNVIDEQEADQYEVPGSDVFKSSALPNQAVDFDERALLTVLHNTRTYFTEQSCQDQKILQDGILETQGVTVEDVIATLDFMITTISEDIKAGQPTRLKDTEFINANFEVIRWLAYDPSYLDELRTRITKYAVFTHAGSRERTELYNTPVYKIKDDIENEDFITRYTKQEALSGIFEPGGVEHGKVETLAYLTREGLEDALLQGTAFVTFPDGTTTYFNVDKNNGIAYVPGLAQPQQERFWYFKEVNKLNGYGHSSDTKIQIEPGVTFAGDVLNIGLGKIVAIEDRNQNLRIGIIADTGGAFLPNLHQLDFFAGVFPDRATYQEAVQQLPEYTPTYFLVKKQVE